MLCVLCVLSKPHLQQPVNSLARNLTGMQVATWSSEAIIRIQKIHLHLSNALTFRVADIQNFEVPGYGSKSLFIRQRTLPHPCGAQQQRPAITDGRTVSKLWAEFFTNEKRFECKQESWEVDSGSTLKDGNNECWGHRGWTVSACSWGRVSCWPTL